MRHPRAAPPDPNDQRNPARSRLGGEISTSHSLDETQMAIAGGPPPILGTKPTPTPAGEDFSGPPKLSSTPKDGTAAAEFLDLRIWAESFADAQQTRIALVNRMERGGVDADLLAGHRDLLYASENAFRLAMVRSYRRAVRAHMPAVEEWQKASFGIGEHLLARLLGHLGHPIIATPYQWTDTAPEGHRCIEERCGQRHLVALQPYERTVSQLWSYCGHGAPVRRKKGMSQEEALGLGKWQCKMLVHLLAEGTIKITPPMRFSTPKPGTAGSPQPIGQPETTTDAVGGKFHYRSVYDTRKAATVDREWTDGHRHADALRIVGKEILRDLWINAHSVSETHRSRGAGGPS